MPWNDWLFWRALEIGRTAEWVEAIDEAFGGAGRMRAQGCRRVSRNGRPGAQS